MTIQETVQSLVHMKFYDGRKVHLGVIESRLTDNHGFLTEWVDSIPLPLCHTSSNYLGQVTLEEVTCERCLAILSQDER